MPVALAMPAAGFYPRGGGQLDAWIEPATPQAWMLTDRGPLQRIRGVAGVANLRDDIAATAARPARSGGWPSEGLDVDLEIEIGRWPSPGQGAALEPDRRSRRTRSPPRSSAWASAASPPRTSPTRPWTQLLAYELAAPGAVDPHSADQILLPLALAEGRSIYTVTEVTEHLRTNAATIRAFLDRPIAIEEPGEDGRPGRVVVG